MRGKSSVLLLGLVFCLCAFLLKSASLHAKEWTVGQKEIVKCLENYMDASKRGSLEEIMSYFHPKFSAWDYEQQLPFGIESVKDWNKQFRMISIEAEPLEISVQGNFAIAHLNYSETFKDNAGIETSLSGRWTVSLVKQDSKWTFLSWSWIVTK